VFSAIYDFNNELVYASTTYFDDDNLKFVFNNAPAGTYHIIVMGTADSERGQGGGGGGGAATVFYLNGNWNTSSNWYSDSAGTTPLGYIPGASGDPAYTVNLLGNSTLDLDALAAASKSQASVINMTSYALAMTSTLNANVTSQINGTTGVVTLNGAAYRRP
jgi:hypothetical protein